MTLDGLRCLCAVVEEQSFRRAAERVHRSQPAVSQQVKGLETEMRQVLIERKTGLPTPAGQCLYERARQILLDADSLGREIRDFDESASHELRLGTSDTTALYILPPVIQAFARAMPQTRLAITSRPSDAIAGQVLQGELALGIVTLPVAQKELESRRLMAQRLPIRSWLLKMASTGLTAPFLPTTALIPPQSI